tara:strand:- start:147 stop:542 length:396 start_codon:yes stop_codon:yes gene_type:complete
MPNYAPKLPLSISDQDGYKMLKTLSDVVKQNFRMLALTSPGERIMMPDFGIGIHRFFFEPMVPGLYNIIESRIKEQVAKYMPFLSIVSIRFTTSDGDTSMEPGKVAISIRYRIPVLNADDEIGLTVNSYGF